MMSKLKRLWMNIKASPRQLKQDFPLNERTRITELVREEEATLGAEIQVVVEMDLPVRDVLRCLTARDAAIRVFTTDRLWDTEGSNAVLLYLLYSEQDIEIVADRMAARAVSHEVWEQICVRIENEIHQHSLSKGIECGVRLIAKELRPHFPPSSHPKDLENLIVRL